MAKIEMKFLDCEDSTTIEVRTCSSVIEIITKNKGCEIINLDIPTAIKFSKTLQAKIREIKNSEFESNSNLF